MSKEPNIAEQIELYLTDRLSESEKIQFESKLQQDPLVREELQFQEDIIHSVQSHRKAQLKLRLDQVPVPNPGIGETAASSLKVAGSILAIAAVGVGAYFYLQQPEVAQEVAQEVDQPVEEVTRESSEETTVTTEDAPQTSSKSSIEPIDKAERKTPEVPQAKIESKPQLAEKTTPAAPVQPQLIQMPEEEGLARADELVKLPDMPVQSDNMVDMPDMAVKKIKDGKHNFHYQYYNDKLFLYGDFQRIPYEILDFAGADSRKLYLFYQDHFYHIQSDQTEIVPLEVIRDESLIEELNILRQSRNR